jgi:hypothetical protein
MDAAGGAAEHGEDNPGAAEHAAGGEDAGDAVRRLSREFLDAFDATARCADGLARVRPTPCNLSTCTFTGQLAFEGLAPEEAAAVFARIVHEHKMELEMLRDLGGGADDDFELSLSCDEDDAEPPAGGGGSRKRKPAERKQRFAHQITFKCGTRSIKLFRNGTVHGTGCPSPVEFLDLVDQFVQFVDRSIGVHLPGQLALAGMQTRMMNAMFVATDRATGAILKIRPDALSRATPRAEHETERHPGVKVCLFVARGGRAVEPADAAAAGAHKVTVRFFQTGTVSVTGAREPAHIAVAHDFACRLLDDHYDRVCRVDAKTSLRTTTAAKRLDLSAGYATNQFNACFMALAD